MEQAAQANSSAETKVTARHSRKHNTNKDNITPSTSLSNNAIAFMATAKLCNMKPVSENVSSSSSGSSSIVVVVA